MVLGRVQRQSHILKGARDDFLVHGVNNPYENIFISWATFILERWPQGQVCVKEGCALNRILTICAQIDNNIYEVNDSFLGCKFQIFF